MMQINSATKLNNLFKFHPGALDAIVSLNDKFQKLKNPLLRKIMAPRTTISMAAKIGGIPVDDFYGALMPLGFTVNKEVSEEIADEHIGSIPFVEPQNIFDARPVLSSGADPLKPIMSLAASVKLGGAFCVINSFEPIPLVELLSKQGFESVTQKRGELEFHTYFKRIDSKKPVAEAEAETADWQAIEERFKGRCNFVDVRQMVAPLPMVTILEELKHLPESHALHVHHKRIPVHLLPELNDRGFSFAFKETGKDEVHLLIFRAA